MPKVRRRSYKHNGESYFLNITILYHNHTSDRNGKCECVHDETRPCNRSYKKGDLISKISSIGTTWKTGYWVTKECLEVLLGKPSEKMKEEIAILEKERQRLTTLKVTKP